MLILGIDPGSQITGYGIIKIDNRDQPYYVTSGHIRITSKNLGTKLKQIYDYLLIIMQQYNPKQVSIEKVFVHKNVNSALKLGQARGAAIVAAATIKLPIYEYSPCQIKQTVTGKGNATKQQVQLIVKNLLSLDNKPQADAADALAIAICHGAHLNAQKITKLLS